MSAASLTLMIAGVATLLGLAAQIAWKPHVDPPRVRRTQVRGLLVITAVLVARWPGNPPLTPLNVRRRFQ